MAAGVETQVFEVNKSHEANPGPFGIYIVFKFYVEESKVYDFYKSIPNTFNASEYDILTGFTKTVSPIVQEVLALHECDEYKEGMENEKEHEKKWIAKLYEECNSRFKANNMLFTLDDKEPVRALFFFAGCGFEYNN